MARVISAPARTLIGGRHFVTKVRVELENQAGGWQDVTAFMGRNFFVSATWREGIDQPVASGQIVLSRRVRGESISPTIEAATANHPGGGAYDPFIRGRQKVRIKTADVAPGTLPLDADYREVFRGRVDSPEWGGRANQVTLPISDQGAWLSGQQIDTVRTYSDDVGQPLEDVMQAILDDNPNPALPGLTLFVPVATGINVKTFQQDRVYVMTALVTLAQQFGYDIRFKYDPADNVSKLTLSLPDRDNDLSAPDWTFGPGEYLELPNVGVNTDDVRTRGRVYYFDGTTGERLFEEYTNAAAVSEFGDIYFEIGEESTSNIDTAPEALNMITAAVKDLSAPKMSQRMETTYAWPVQLGDILEFLPNEEHYDEPQYLAAVGIEHTLTKDQRRSAFDVRGNPAGAYARWLAIGVSGERPEAPTLEDVLTRPSVTPYFHPDTHAVDALVDVNPTATASIKVLASGTHVPTAAEVAATGAIATGGAARVTVAGVITAMDPNVTAYISALAYDADGNPSDLASTIVTWPVGDVAPTVELLYAYPNPLTGLTVDVGLHVTALGGVGGSLRVWTNHDSVDTPNYAGAIEGRRVIASTPVVVNEATDFLVEPSETGTFKYLNDIRVHPTQGKIIYAEFIDAAGRSSGQQAFTLNGGGGILDDNGNLKPGAVFSPTQIVDSLITAPKFDPGLRVPQFSATLPTGTPAEGTGALRYYNGLVYRYIGAGVWDASTAAGNISGQLSGAQITAGAITATHFASGIQPVQVVGSVGAMNPSVSYQALNTSNGLLYLYQSGSWVPSSSASLIVGQIVAGQIAAGAVNTTELAAGAITSAKIAAGAITADKLFVYGSTGAALNRDPNTADASAWTDAVTAGPPVISLRGLSVGKVGNFALSSAINGPAYIIGNQFIPLDPLKVYRVRGWVYNAGANGTLYLGVQSYDTSFVATSMSGGGGFYTTSGVTPPNGQWSEWVGYVGAGQVGSSANNNAGLSEDPAAYTSGAAKWIRPYALLNYVGTAGYMLLQDFRIEEVSPGTLIQDGAITTAKIVAGAITSNELAANAATFGKVAAGAIGVDQMRANSVGATQIIAGSIQADKFYTLMPGPGGTLNADPEMKDPSAWSIGAGVHVGVNIGSAGKTGIYAAVSDPGSSTSFLSAQLTDVDPNKTYRVRCWIRKVGGNGVMYTGVQVIDAAGANISGNGSYWYVGAVGSSPTDGVWTEFIGTLGVGGLMGGFPSNARRMGLICLINYGGTAGYYQLQDFRLEEVIPGTLIRDGSIITQHLTSSTVTSAVMSIGNLQSISPNMGILVTGKLSSLANGTYLDLDATGSSAVLHHAKFNLYANGNAAFTGDITGASGTFSGSLSGASITGATGTFSGALSGATGTFAGALSGATGSFGGDVTAGGAVYASAFYSTYAAFSGRLEMRGTIRLMSDSTYGGDLSTDYDGGVLFYRYDYGYIYGRVSMQSATGLLTMQSNGGITIDAGNYGASIIGTGAAKVRRNLSGTSSVLEVENDSYGSLFIVDVPTNNNDTGLQVIYRNESGAYSFKRIRGDNTNTGGAGNRNLRVLN